MRKLILLFFLGLFSTLFVQAQFAKVDHRETAIFTSEEWKYHVGTTAPDPNWRDDTYNDASWSAAKAG
ncbi:hypothetical protein N8085_00115 [Salibacteraceae bacterium]|nr:hypothetical protein [Salibacteraceae bacterium]